MAKMGIKKDETEDQGRVEWGGNGVRDDQIVDTILIISGQCNSLVSPFLWLCGKAGACLSTAPLGVLQKNLTHFCPTLG